MSWTPENAKVRVSRLGKVRIGKKKQSASGKQYPSAVDYFIPVGNFSHLFTEALGESPDKIKIVLPSDSIEDFFEIANRCYNGKNQLYCIGNPMTGKANRAQGNGTLTEDVSCPCEYLTTDKHRYKCSAVARLSFFIAKISSVFGVWTFETRSKNSIDQILTALKICKGQNGGHLAGAELWLTVSMWNGRGGRKFPVVSLIPCCSEGLDIAKLKGSVLLPDDDEESCHVDDAQVANASVVVNDETQATASSGETSCSKPSHQTDSKDGDRKERPNSGVVSASKYGDRNQVPKGSVVSASKYGVNTQVDKCNVESVQDAEKTEIMNRIKKIYSILGWPDNNDQDYAYWSSDAGTIEDIENMGIEMLAGVEASLVGLKNKKVKKLASFIKQMTTEQKAAAKEIGLAKGGQLSYREAKQIYEHFNNNIK